MGAHWAALTSGIGTLGAFAVGGSILIRDLARQRRADERAQAGQVAAWIGQVDAEDGEEPCGVPGMRTPGPWPCVWIRNGSDLPVYEWIIMVYKDGQRVEWTWRSPDQLAPRSQRAILLVEAFIGPNRSIETRVAMRFTDAAGRQWFRRGDGSLSRARPKPSVKRLMSEYVCRVDSIGGVGSEQD